MNCPRCEGLMVRDDFLGLQDEMGQYAFAAWRCLICGEVLDPVILKHRSATSKPTVGRVRVPTKAQLVPSDTREPREFDLYREPAEDPDRALFFALSDEFPCREEIDSSDLKDVDV